MAESRNFKELLQLLNDCQVEYLIVGGYAVIRYSDRASPKISDIWVGISQPNSYQIGVAPVRVDILTTITGCTFESAWDRRGEGRMYDTPVHFISLQDLIANKRAAGRAGDIEHLKSLE